MEFNKYDLIFTIKKAQNSNDIVILKELLFIYNQLLKQETINNNIIETFYCYQKISQNTIEFYNRNKKNRRYLL